MSELTEDQKLVKLGLRSPNQTQSAASETIQKLKSNIAQAWEDFQTEFDNAGLGSWADFESWLSNNGFSADDASNIRSNFESKYASWSEFSDKILNEYDSWAAFENDFASNSGLRSDRLDEDSNLPAAGVKMYEEAGVGRNGQSIPAGGIEVYGKEVHISNTANVRATKDESAGTQDPIVWSNLSVSPTTADLNEDVTVEADVTNNTGFIGNVVAELIVDDTVVSTVNTQLSGNTTKTVAFDWSAGFTGEEFEVGIFDVGISKAGTQEVTVVHPNLV